MGSEMCIRDSYYCCLDDLIFEIQSSTVSPFGSHQLEMSLDLFHAKLVVLQLTQLAIPQNVLDYIVVFPADFQGLPTAQCQIPVDTLKNNGLLSGSESASFACAVYLLELFLYLI